MVVRKTGHCGHRTSLPLDLHMGDYMKNMVYERKVNRANEMEHIISMLQDAEITLLS
jgi:hypothetical protein